MLWMSCAQGTLQFDSRLRNRVWTCCGGYMFTLVRVDRLVPALRFAEQLLVNVRAMGHDILVVERQK
jgi:hypothetical protein